MAISNPAACIGLDISNPTFSIPKNDGSGKADGWTMSGGTAAYAGVSVAGHTGHDRLQQITVTASGTTTLVGAPCSPGLLCTAASTKIRGMLTVGVTGVQFTAVELYIRWLNSSGVQVGSDVQLVATSGLIALGLTSWVATATPPANAFCAVPVIKIVRTNTGTTVVQLAFAGIGCWDGATSEKWDWARKPGFPGTGAAKTSAVEMIRPLYGRPYSIDRTRYGKPYRLSMSVSGWTNTEKGYLERLWAFNTGRSSETLAAGNPGGGVWPVLIAPGLPGAPAAMLCDFEQSGQFPLGVDGGWYADPPYWGGSFTLLERV